MSPLRLEEQGSLGASHTRSESVGPSRLARPLPTRRLGRLPIFQYLRQLNIKGHPRETRRFSRQKGRPVQTAEGPRRPGRRDTQQSLRWTLRLLRCLPEVFRSG